MNISEALYGAADHISAFGHNKGSGFAEGTSPSVAPACIIGALNIVAKMDRSVTSVAIILMGEHVGSSAFSIVDWNDAPERTAAEVVEALRAAAVIEAARESESRLLDGPRIPQPADQRPRAAL